LVAHLHFLPTHKATLKNAKELPSQRTQTRQFIDNTRQKNKGERITNAIANAGMRVG
jgi:hypothetical protein